MLLFCCIMSLALYVSCDMTPIVGACIKWSVNDKDLRIICTKDMDDCQEKLQQTNCASNNQKKQLSDFCYWIFLLDSVNLASSIITIIIITIIVASLNCLLVFNVQVVLEHKVSPDRFSMRLWKCQKKSLSLYMIWLKWFAKMWQTSLKIEKGLSLMWTKCKKQLT